MNKKDIKYITICGVCFVLGSLFALNIALNILNSDYIFAFLSFTMTINAFAICTKSLMCLIGYANSIREEKGESINE